MEWRFPVLVAASERTGTLMAIESALPPAIRGQKLNEQVSAYIIGPQRTPMLLLQWSANGLSFRLGRLAAGSALGDG